MFLWQWKQDVIKHVISCERWDFHQVSASVWAAVAKQAALTWERERERGKERGASKFASSNLRFEPRPSAADMRSMSSQGWPYQTLKLIELYYGDLLINWWTDWAWNRRSFSFLKILLQSLCVLCRADQLASSSYIIPPFIVSSRSIPAKACRSLKLLEFYDQEQNLYWCLALRSTKSEHPIQRIIKWAHVQFTPRTEASSNLTRDNWLKADASGDSVMLHYAAAGSSFPSSSSSSLRRRPSTGTSA